MTFILIFLSHNQLTVYISIIHQFPFWAPSMYLKVKLYLEASCNVFQCEEIMSSTMHWWRSQYILQRLQQLTWGLDQSIVKVNVKTRAVSICHVHLFTYRTLISRVELQAYQNNKVCLICIIKIYCNGYIYTYLHEYQKFEKISCRSYI